MAKKWYIVHTYTGHEENVKESLRQRAETKGLGDSFGEILIPTEDVIERKRGKKVVSSRRFFPGYILVEMEMSKETWHIVKKVPKVTGFLGTGDDPTPLEPEEVEEIKAKMTSSAEEPQPKFSFEEGDEVRIVEGSFSDFSGRVESVNEDKKLLKVMVTIFGRETPVEVDFLQAEKI